MAIKSIPLLRGFQTLGLGADVDFLRTGVQTLAQELIEAECTEKVGAGRYERTEERTTSRNGYRLRAWDTRVGRIVLRIPKLRKGCFFVKAAGGTSCDVHHTNTTSWDTTHSV